MSVDIERSRLSYREHHWTVIPRIEDDQPTLRDDNFRLVCDSSSQRAIDWASSPRRFFFDFELLAAGLEPGHGGHVSVLSEPWHGHRPGALVMTVFVPDDSDMGVHTLFCVADDVVVQDGAR